MRILKLFPVALAIAVIASAISYEFNRATRGSVLANDAERSSSPLLKTTKAEGETTFSSKAATQRYRLDASRSKFIAHALAGGLLWFKGHDHLVAVREFTGEAQLTPDSISPASLEITAKAG